MENQGMKQNGTEKHRWGCEGWKQASARVWRL